MLAPRLVLRLSVCTLLAALGFAAGAQPSEVRLTSLEAVVLNADAVAEATLTRYTLAEGAKSILDATFTVDHALKGDVPQTVTVILHRGLWTFDAWQEGKSHMLLSRNGSSWSVTELDNPKAPLLSADFKVLRTPDAVVSAAKETVRSHPGVTSILTVRIAVPNGVAKNFPQTGMGTYVEVPADQELERRALGAYRSSQGLTHLEIANILGHFKSDENIAVLKELLSDPSFATYGYSDNRIGHTHRAYLARRAAFNSLANFGIKVPEPVMDEDIFDPEKVTYVYLERDPDVSRKIRGLVEFPNLRWVDVDQAPAGDADVRTIASLPSVDSLSLNRTRITDASLMVLGRMTGLIKLGLAATSITDAGLARLSGLQSLQELDLSGTSIDDHSLAEVAKLKNLRTLSLANTKVTLHGLAVLKDLKFLSEVHMPETDWQIGDKQFAELADSGLLHTYHALYAVHDSRAARDDEVVRALFFYEKLTDAGLPALLRLRNLEGLMLPASAISDEGMKTVAKFKKLESLGANDTQIGDQGLRALAGLDLRSLGLANTRVTDDGMSVLESMPHLKLLVLNKTKITDDGLSHVAKLKALQNLQIVDTAVGDPGVKFLIDLPALESLGISGSQVTDAGLLDISKIKKLKMIYIFNAKSLTQAGLAKFRRLRPDVNIQG